MRSDTHHPGYRRPGSTQSPVKFERKHQIGKLRLPICSLRAIALDRLQIVKVQLSALVRNRSECDNTRPLRVAGSRALKCRKKHRSQRKMAQHIRSELDLKTIRSLQPFLRSHHARIVDQQVERNSKRQLRRSKRANGLKRRQIEQHYFSLGPRIFGTHTRKCCVTFGLVAARQQHVSAIVREFSRRIIANATVRSGNQRAPAHLAGNVCHRPAFPRFFICHDLLIPFFNPYDACQPSLSEPPHIFVKNAVGLQIPGSEEQSQHQARSPAEHLNWKSACQGLHRLTKDHPAGQAYPRRQRKQDQRVPCFLFKIARWNQECTVENGAQRQHTQHQRDRLGELQQHATHLASVSSLPPLDVNRVNKPRVTSPRRDIVWTTFVAWRASEMTGPSCGFSAASCTCKIQEIPSQT